MTSALAKNYNRRKIAFKIESNAGNCQKGNTAGQIKIMFRFQDKRWNKN